MTWVAADPALTWWQALPALLGAVALLWAPGAVIARLTGARGRELLAVAPVLTIGSLGALAAAGSLVPALRHTWTGGWALAALALTAAGALVLRYLVGWRAVPEPDDRARSPRLDVVPVALACLVSGVTFALASGAAGTIEQSNDSPFHLLAVQRVATTGDGSWQNIRAVTGDTGFYPPLADDLAALLLRVLYAVHLPVDVVSASSVLLMVCVALVWPLGVDALVRAVVGPRGDRAARIGAMLVVPATAAFPAQLLAFGALWPNLLGLALAPAVLAAACTLFDGRPRRGRGSGAWTPVLALLVLLVGSLGLALAHPSALLSTGVAGFGLLVGAGVRLARRRRVLGGLVLGLGALGALAVGLLLVRMSSAVTEYSTSQPWSVPQALGRVVALNPVAGTAPALAGLLALVGVVDACVRRRHLWLVVGWAVTALQVVLAGSVDARITGVLTGLWYHEPARLSAALALTCVPLAALGAAAIVRVAARVLPDRATSTETTAGTAPAGARATGGASVLGATAATAATAAPGPRPSRAAVAALGVVALAWAGIGVRDVHAVERDTYQGLTADRTLVTPAEMALFRRTLGTTGDADGTGGVVGDPFGGAMFATLASGRPSVVTHFGQNLVRGTPKGRLSDTARVVYHFERLTTDPQVCAAVRRLHVGYAVEDSRPIWTNDPRASSFDALRGLAGRPGLQLVGREGTTSVYRITACR